MQTVSTEWKEAMGCFDYADRPNFVPETFVEVSYSVNDPAAQGAAVAADNGSTDYSNTAQTVTTVDKNYVPYAVAELNSWILDGSRTLLGESALDTGFVSSELSGADCKFSTNPVLTVTLDKVYNTLIPGITVEWSTAFSEMAWDFTITAYNGNNVVATLPVTGNTDVISFTPYDLSGYDKITIEVNEWGYPYHRARIERVILGVEVVFGKADILNYEHKQSADLLSLTLPETEIVFEITNIDGAWNPDNPTGKVKYLMERQNVRARYGLKLPTGIEWIPAGDLFVNGWETPQNGISATFTAVSLVDLLDMPYVVPTNRTLTLKALVEDALTQANLPVAADGMQRWTIDDSLAAINVTIPDSFEQTVGGVIQLAANAAQCVMQIDRTGKLNIQPLDSTMTDYLIDRFVSFKNAEYTLSKPLKSVTVNEDMATAAGEENGEIQKIDNPLIQNESVAQAVADWVKNMLIGRKTLAGDYRPDPRLDVFDVITTQNKYASNTAIVTDVSYQYTGSFSGNYEGRVAP